MKHILSKKEKIRFLTGVNEGRRRIEELIIPECEIWERQKENLFVLKRIHESEDKASKYLNFEEMEARISNNRGTTIRTNNNEKIVIF